MKVLFRRARSAASPCTFLLAMVVSVSSLAVEGGVAGDVWLVNTRGAPSCGTLTPAHQGISFSKCDDAGNWSPADRESFLASSDPSIPTVVFIHGNRTDNGWAVKEGMGVFPHLKKVAANKPFRYVIWSWPSEITHKHARPDVRAKNVRSDADAFYLAGLIRELDPEVRVSMIGFSLGARVIAGNLHLLGGGQVAGRCLDSPEAAGRAPMRVVLIAAAIDQDSFAPNGRFALAPTVAERIVVTVNQRDRALKWYPRLYGRGGPSAMGYVGAALCDGNDSVETFNLTNCVGAKHNWNTYACCVKLANVLGDDMLLGD